MAIVHNEYFNNFLKFLTKQFMGCARMFRQNFGGNLKIVEKEFSERDISLGEQYGKQEAGKAKQ